MTKREQHETQRRQLWIEAWTGKVSNTCKDPKDISAFADQALADYDRRFPTPVNLPNIIEHGLSDDELQKLIKVLREFSFEDTETKVLNFFSRNHLRLDHRDEDREEYE